MESRAQESLLIARAQAGDRDAFAELFLLLHPALLRYVAGLAGRECAEDILQEAFLQIYRKLRWLQEPRAFRAWSYRIATRLAFGHLNRERRWAEQIRDEDLLNNLPALEGHIQLEVKEHFDELIREVSPKSRAVLLMRFCEELSLKEIALILDIPMGTVKSRLAYGVAALRRIGITERTIP